MYIYIYTHTQIFIYANETRDKMNILDIYIYVHIYIYMIFIFSMLIASATGFSLSFWLAEEMLTLRDELEPGGGCVGSNTTPRLVIGNKPRWLTVQSRDFP